MVWYWCVYYFVRWVDLIDLLTVDLGFGWVSRCGCGLRVFGLSLSLTLVLNVAMVLVGRFLILFGIWFGV